MISVYFVDCFELVTRGVMLFFNKTYCKTGKVHISNKQSVFCNSTHFDIFGSDKHKTQVSCRMDVA